MKRNSIIATVAVVIITVCSLLFYSQVLSANKTTSPNREHWVSYNRITKTITVAEANSDLRYYFDDYTNPTFFWSPNSRFLAMTITDESGNRRSKVLDIELNNNTIIPTQLDTQASITEEKSAQVVVREWIDNDNIVVNISYYSEERRGTVRGSFVFTLSSYMLNEIREEL